MLDIYNVNEEEVFKILGLKIHGVGMFFHYNKRQQGPDIVGSRIRNEDMEKVKMVIDAICQTLGRQMSYEL